MATHDYNLANQSGASFRSDLNDALQAVLTNNSSASSPSTTAAYMFWADTNTGILKIRNSANDAWVELLQLDGTLTIEDGSASAVGLGFRDELNTGIFSSGASNFDVAIAGTTRLNISATGLNVTGGITTSDDLTIPDKIIHSGDTNTAIRFPAADTFTIETAGSDRLRVDSAGNCGIGTSSTDNLLHLFESNTTQTADSSSQLVLEKNSDSGITILSGNTTNGRILFGDSGDNDIGQIDYDHNNNSLRLVVNASERLKIESDGKVTCSGPQLIVGANDGDPAELKLIYTTVPTYLTSTFDGTVGEATLSVNVPRTSDGSGSWGSHSNTNYGSAAIQVLSHPSSGGYVAFLTSSADNTNPTEKARVSGSGTLFIGGTTAPTTGENGAAFPSAGIHVVARNVSSGSNSVFRALGAAGFFRSMGDGDAQNTNNSYGGTSDQELKENIVDANSQWDDIKALKVRNYNFKESTGFSTHKQIGVIAQELEASGMNGLVKINDDELYGEGDTLPDGKNIGDVKEKGYRAVAYSVLYMKAIKALQEAMAKIETLETKVAALEAG